MRCAVLDLGTNMVINIIMADPTADQPVDGCALVGLDSDPPCDIGWLYDANASMFINLNPTPDPIPDSAPVSVDEVSV